MRANKILKKVIVLISCVSILTLLSVSCSTLKKNIVRSTSSLNSLSTDCSRPLLVFNYNLNCLVNQVDSIVKSSNAVVSKSETESFFCNSTFEDHAYTTQMNNICIKQNINNEFDFAMDIPKAYGSLTTPPDKLKGKLNKTNTIILNEKIYIPFGLIVELSTFWKKCNLNKNEGYTYNPKTNQVEILASSSKCGDSNEYNEIVVHYFKRKNVVEFKKTYGTNISKEIISMVLNDTQIDPSECKMTLSQKDQKAVLSLKVQGGTRHFKNPSDFKFLVEEFCANKELLVEVIPSIKKDLKKVKRKSYTANEVKVNPRFKKDLKKSKRKPYTANVVKVKQKPYTANEVKVKQKPYTANEVSEGMTVTYSGSIKFIKMGYSMLTEGIDYTLKDGNIIFNGTFANGSAPLFEGAPIYIFYKD